MINRMPRSAPSRVFIMNYEKILIGLTIVYFLDGVYLFTTQATLEMILKAAQLALLLCIGLLFAVQRVSRQRMVFSLLVLAVFTLSTLFSGAFPYLKYGIVLLAGISCNWEKTYKRLCRTYLWLIVVTLLLGWCGILPSRIVRRGYSTYGFVHSNVLALYLLVFLCCYLLTNEHRFGWKNYAVSFLVTVFTWKLTDSRTTLLAMIVLILLFWVVRSIPRLFETKQIMYYISIAAPLLMMGLSLYVSNGFRNYGAGFIDIDTLLNGRLQLASNLMNTVSITAFGQRISITMVENAYISGLYNFGLIPIAAELMIYMYAIRKSLRHHTYAKLACLLAFALHGLTESGTFDPFFNVALLSVFSRGTKYTACSSTASHAS